MNDTGANVEGGLEAEADGGNGGDSGDGRSAA
jgi:hypothetical protein